MFPGAGPTRRWLRCLLLLTAATVGLFVALDTVWILTPSAMTPAPATWIGNDPSATDIVAVTEVPQSNGNINLMLSINVKGIMRFLDEHTVILDAKSMTSDPPPPDVAILQHDPKRCSKPVTWLICVFSYAKDGNRRELLRTTWASDDMFEGNDTRVVFFVGVPRNGAVRKDLKEEMATFGDIVQGNFTEDEYSWPTRARLMLKWTTTYCQKAAFLLRVYDNSLVDIIRLMALVSKEQTTPRVLACPLVAPHTRLIDRDPRRCRAGSRFHASCTGFPGMTHFPQHCAAAGYVLSHELVGEMYKAIESTAGFWLEEIYMTTMLTAKIKRIQYIDFADRYTTIKRTALVDTTVLGQRKFLISIPSLEDFIFIWKWMLGVLEHSELLLLSRQYIAKRPEISPKLRGTTVAVGSAVNVTKKPSR